MDIKIEGFTTKNNKYYQSTLNLRSDVFVEEMNFEKRLEFDGKDDLATHYILFCDMIPIGCARWIEDKNNKSIVIDRFCITKEYRKRGFAMLLLKFILRELIPSGKTIKIVATNSGFLFFTQANFKITNDNFKLGNKPLQVMEYKVVKS